MAHRRFVHRDRDFRGTSDNKRLSSQSILELDGPVVRDNSRIPNYLAVQVVLQSLALNTCCGAV